MSSHRTRCDETKKKQHGSTKGAPRYRTIEKVLCALLPYVFIFSSRLVLREMYTVFYSMKGYESYLQILQYNIVILD